MKASQVKVGETYRAKVSGRVVRVRITGMVEHVGKGLLWTTRHGMQIRPCRISWAAVNLETGRELEFKTAARLRPEV
jgi:hypothetical protein